MPGPPPAEKRRRRNADTYSDVAVHVPRTSRMLRGPTLAKATFDQSLKWEPEVKSLTNAWWETWRRSPLAETFLDTDWQRLAMLAPMVASYYARPHYTKLAEIRQNESLLGATHVDRLKARIKVDVTSPPAQVPAGVAAMDEYRARLAG